MSLQICTSWQSKLHSTNTKPLSTAASRSCAPAPATGTWPAPASPITELLDTRTAARHHKTLTREQSRTGGSCVAWRRRSVFRSAALTSCSWSPADVTWLTSLVWRKEGGRKRAAGRTDERTSSCGWRRAPRRNTGGQLRDRDEMPGSLAGYTRWVVTRAGGACCVHGHSLTLGEFKSLVRGAQGLGKTRAAVRGSEQVQMSIHLFVRWALARTGCSV